MASVANNRNYEMPDSSFDIVFLGGQLPKTDDLELTAALVLVLDDANKLLAIKNKRGWDIPGGHIEDNETPKQAAVREVAEEACVEINSLKPFALLQNSNSAMVVYTAKLANTRKFMPDKSDPITARKFVTPDEFMRIYGGGDRQTMQKLIAKLRQDLETK